MLGVSLRDRIRNEQISRRTKITTLSGELPALSGSGRSTLLAAKTADGAKKILELRNIIVEGGTWVWETVGCG